MQECGISQSNNPRAEILLDVKGEILDTVFLDRLRFDPTFMHKLGYKNNDLMAARWIKRLSSLVNDSNSEVAQEEQSNTQLSSDGFKKMLEGAVLSFIFKEDATLYLGVMQLVLDVLNDEICIKPFADELAKVLNESYCHKLIFNLAAFAKNAQVSPQIISAVFSSLKILDEKLEIPTDASGSLINLNIPFKHWAVYNDPISKIKKGYFGEVILDLQSLNLSDIDGLGEFLQKHKNIVCIYLGNNTISSIPAGAFNNLPWLKVVSLDRNKISSIEAASIVNCPCLKILGLSHNKINELPMDFLSKNPQLEEVDFADNNIKSLPISLLKNNPNLARIDLDNNQITSLKAGVFNGCSKLQKIGLRCNKISSMQGCSFNNCLELVEVDLSHNNINSVELGLFNNCSKLKDIYLSGNKISSLQKEMCNNCPLISKEWAEFEKDVLASQKKSQN